MLHVTYVGVIVIMHQEIEEELTILDTVLPDI